MNILVRDFFSDHILCRWIISFHSLFLFFLLAFLLAFLFYLLEVLAQLNDLIKDFESECNFALAPLRVVISC